MPVYKDESSGTWYVSKRYVDWQGKNKRLFKRNFATKREALKYEREFFEKLSGNVDMNFGAFIDVYYQDKKPRLKLNTFLQKQNVIEKNIRPYFKDKRICDITVQDVMKWQNEMITKDLGNGKTYDQSTLRTIHAQLSAILNHAVRYYQLDKNPANIVGTIGKRGNKEMLFWTNDEYKLFSEQVMHKTITYMAFQVLYWCGIRVGELLALTKEDIDLVNKKIRINKSYQRLEGEDVITSPKTEKSNRTIDIPDFLAEELNVYLINFYKLSDKDRVFPITKNHLHREIKKGAAKAGIKQIRVHDLRHSHVSLLIEMGFSPVAIAERVGHESIDITYHYAHLFPSKGKEIASKLNKENGVIDDVSEK